jgi:hypothetical protein
MREHDAIIPGPRSAALASALHGRLPALADEMFDHVLKQSESGGRPNDIYGDDRVVPVDDLHQSMQDSITFVVSNLDRPGPPDLTAPRRTGRRRAEQGAPLAAVLSSFQAGFGFIWDALVAEAHETGIVSDAELVGVASEVWVLTTLFTAELATAYRDTLAEQVRHQDQERSALVQALLDGRIADTATVWEAADLLGLPSAACSRWWPRKSRRWPGLRCRASRPACTCGAWGRPGGCCPSSRWGSCR